MKVQDYIIEQSVSQDLYTFKLFLQDVASFTIDRLTAVINDPRTELPDLVLAKIKEALRVAVTEIKAQSTEDLANSLLNSFLERFKHQNYLLASESQKG